MTDRSPGPRSLHAYGVAVVGVTITVAAKFLADRTIGQGPPLIVFILPVLIAARYGGTGPELVATALSAFSCLMLFLPPAGSMSLDSRIRAISPPWSATESRPWPPWRGSCDVVLMDIQMPTMDGFEAVAALREREQRTGQHVPVIALTAQAMKGDRERCLQAGFDAHVCKPIQVQELCDALRDVIAGPDPQDDPPVVSLEPLLETCAGDVEFLQELIESYLETSPRLLAGIDAALENGDADRLAAEAHGWKGINQTMRLEELTSLCRRLEETGRRGNLSQAQAISLSLHAAWQRIRPSLGNSLRDPV
jgi:CheY-like chemotaxis protein